MEEDSIVGVFCRRWGVPLIDGGTVRLPRLIGLSRALDLILTGRPVNAKEALSMGLANKIVPHGCARKEAEKLADMISNFPQTCLREDRMSVYEQFGLSFQDALQNEFQHGLKTIYSGETIKGASQFTKGEGRHGSFQNFQSKL
jgi:enoyl-CoA hydratase